MAHAIYPPGYVTDDVCPGRLNVTTGTGRVPDKTGLGLELDPDKLKRAAARFEKDGAYPLFDPASSPVWVPMG